MKKILAVTITPGSAVDRIAEMYQRYNEHLGIEILPFHAKRYSEGDLKVFELMARDADLICFEYWRGAQVLTEKFPWLKDKKKVVVHHNPYDLHKYDFSDFDAVVVNNTYQAKELPGSIYIPLAVDLDFFKFNNDYDLKSKTVGMVAFRIEGKKGIREVAQACRELGYKFILVGKVSKPDYMKEIMEVNPETEFRQEVPDDELKQAYYDMGVLVCNSVDEFECYDDKTEVLTDEGWKLFKNLNRKEKVATLNSGTNQLEYQKPVCYIDKEYDGDLYCLDNRAVSFAVTSNHKMWIARATTGEGRVSMHKAFELVRADELPSNFKMQRMCKWEGDRYREYDKNWFRFLGIWLAEGSVYRQSENSCRITISAVKSKPRSDIEKLLKEMSISYRKDKDGFRFSENQKSGYKFKWGEYLEKFGKAPDKYIPREVLDAKSSNINEFLNWYAKGDGSIHNGERILYTSSEKMADGLQECFIKVGNSAHITVRDRRKKRIWIQNHWASRNYLSYIVYEKAKKKEIYVRRNMDMEKRHYDGRVYCVEVPNHIVLVRRNKKVMFCGNSGPMPVLEAMACGTPVLTRDVGHIPDLYDGGNMMVRGGATEDIEDLKDSLKEMMESGEARLKLRKNGWNTIKNWDARRLAVRYAGVFNRAMFPVKSMVSVITATYNRKEQLFKIIEALDRQTYENIELVVCDDWSEDGTESAVKNMRDQVRYPIKYVNTSRSGYNLAMARNMGAIEAEGDMLMFLDSRLCPENDAIERFVERIGSKKLWLFGEKGGGKRSFVENFSMVRRKHFIRAGMMLERVSEYGGMSQELRERFGSQGFGFAYVPEARAREIKKAQKFANKMDSIKRMKFLIWKMGYGRREEEN